MAIDCVKQLANQICKLEQNQDSKPLTSSLMFFVEQKLYNCRTVQKVNSFNLLFEPEPVDYR